MSDLTKTREHVAKAGDEIKKALEALTPIASIRTIDAYIVGFLRAAATVLQEACNAIDQTTTFKKVVSKTKREDP
jgi:hypothetical protein